MISNINAEEKVFTDLTNIKYNGWLFMTGVDRMFPKGYNPDRGSNPLPTTTFNKGYEVNQK